jgi:diamine N-acetyltransferase
MTTKISRATITDITTLCELGCRTFEDTFGGTCTKADMAGVLKTYFNRKQVEAELTDSNDFHYLVYYRNKPVGFYRLNAKHDCPIATIQKSNAIELKRFYLLKQYHGKGIANEMMNHVLATAKALQHRSIYLSVWEYNFRAKGFYAKHGFVDSKLKNDFPLGSTPQTDYWYWRKL